MVKFTQNWKEHKLKLGQKVMTHAGLSSSKKSLDQKKQPGFYETKRILSRYVACASDQKRRSRFELSECSKHTVKSILTSEACYKAKNGLSYLAHRFENFNFNTLALTKIGLSYNKAQGCVTTIRNRCVVSGRNNTIAKFGLSRICFRRYAGLGQIPGLLKL